MPNGQFLSMPAAAAGAAPASSASAWAFGSWVSLGRVTNSALAAFGLQWQNQSLPADDVTQEILWEIGTGESGLEQTRIQIPYSFRRDSNIGYFLMTPYHVFLPEPVMFYNGTRLWVRVTDSIASALTYTGAKLIYRDIELLPLTLNNYLHIDGDNGLSVAGKIR